MLRTGWSYPQLMALPDDYVEALEEALRHEDDLLRDMRTPRGR